MRLEDLRKVVVDRFNGLYDRGIDDEVPPDHARDCPNVIFEPGQVSTREDVVSSVVLGHAVVKRMFLATFNDTTIVLLTLDGSGNIYKDSDAVPLLTVIGMTDFAALNIFNKTYISPCNEGVGVGNLKVWKDSASAVRDAGGAAPVSAPTAVDGAAGDVDPGVHKIAVSYETDTGFITPPGPSVSYTAPGGKKINLSNIPTGPPYVAKRHIVVTRADEEEFFFVPGGVIPDNVTTILTIDFFDTDLVISADYLFDLKTTIPAGCGLAKYHGRMLVWGGEGDLIRVSRVADPESFSTVDGFIQLPSERDGNTVKGSCQLRDVLYFTKFPGIYATEDDGNPPSNWRVITIDGGVGSFYYGISTITASQPALAHNDTFLMSDRGGLFLFDGVIRRPELTWRIQDVWSRITKGKEFNITVFIDPFNRRVYLIMPVDGSTVPNLFLMGDFSEGLTGEKIKWSNWTFPFVPSAIAMAFLTTDSLYLLRFGDSTNTLKRLLGTAGSDGGTAINSYYTTGLLSIQDGWLQVFRALRFRALGAGNLVLTLTGEDGVGSVSPSVIALAASPGKELLRQTNFTAEKMSVKFGANTVTHKFTVQKLEVFGASRFSTRPA